MYSNKTSKTSCTSIQLSEDFSIEQQPVGKVFPCPLAVGYYKRIVKRIPAGALIGTKV